MESLLLLENYFLNGTIVGVDITKSDVADKSGRIFHFKDISKIKIFLILLGERLRLRVLISSLMTLLILEISQK